MNNQNFLKARNIAIWIFASINPVLMGMAANFFNMNVDRLQRHVPIFPEFGTFLLIVIYFFAGSWLLIAQTSYEKHARYFAMMAFPFAWAFAAVVFAILYSLIVKCDILYTCFR